MDSSDSLDEVEPIIELGQQATPSLLSFSNHSHSQHHLSEPSALYEFAHELK